MSASVPPEHVERVYRYPCRLCRNTADGELEGFGLLCVDCADRVIDRMFAVLEAEPHDRYAVAVRLQRAAPLDEPDPTAAEPINWRRYLPRTRNERRAEWRRLGFIE